MLYCMYYHRKMDASKLKRVWGLWVNIFIQIDWQMFTNRRFIRKMDRIANFTMSNTQWCGDFVDNDYVQWTSNPPFAHTCARADHHSMVYPKWSNWFCSCACRKYTQNGPFDPQTQQPFQAIWTDFISHYNK